MQPGFAVDNRSARIPEPAGMAVKEFETRSASLKDRRGGLA